MPQCRRLVFANQKGGVGKTTSALNIASALAQKQSGRVLLIDADPQASASMTLLPADIREGIARSGRTLLTALFKRCPLEDVILRASDTALPFDLAPSDLFLADMESRRGIDTEFLLGELLDDIDDRYSWVIIDPPPNIGTLTSMALTAADYVVVPVRTEYTDIQSLDSIDETIMTVRKRLNHKLRLVGYLPTQVDRRKTVDRDMLSRIGVREFAHQPHSLLRLEAVPSSALYGRASVSGVIACTVYPTAPTVRPYMELAQSLIDLSKSTNK